jgi:hypothetical protein
MLTLGAASTLTSSPAEAVTSKNVEKKIMAAKTAEDHKAIAEYYRGEAAKAKIKVTEHEKMAEAYRKAGFGTVTKIPNSPGTIDHCNQLVQTYKSLAEMQEMMAKDHEAMAAQAK